MAIICRGGQELRGQFGTGPDAKLLEDVPDMSLHSILRHEHRCGDLFVGPALGDQRGDALLGAGEPVRREELHQAHARPPQINLAEQRIAENKSSADSRTSTRSPPDSFAATRSNRLPARSVFKPHTLIVENY